MGYAASAVSDERNDRLYLVDGTSQLFRAYFAIQGLSNRAGQATNAVYGFTSMLRKLLQDEQPDYVGVVFDPPGRTMRHESYPAYKANRPPQPDDLRSQIPLAKEVCDALGIAVIEQRGYEADDVIASYAAQAEAAGRASVVVASDKDLLQLVRERVTVLNPIRYEKLDAAAVRVAFGTPPEHVVDALGLMGDSVDNIPGVPGVGEKTATAIVSTYGPLDAVLERARRFVEVYGARDAALEAIDRLAAVEAVGGADVGGLHETLERTVRTLERLIEVERDASLRERLDEAARGAAAERDRPAAERTGRPGKRVARDLAPLKKTLKALDRASARRVWYAIDEHAEQARVSRGLATLRPTVPLEHGLDALRRREPDGPRTRALFERLEFRALELEEFASGRGGPADRPVFTSGSDYTVAADDDAVAQLVGDCRRTGVAALFVVAEGRDPLRARASGIAISCGAGAARFIPRREPGMPPARSVGTARLPFDGPAGEPARAQAADGATAVEGWPGRAALAGLLGDPRIPKLTHDVKRAEHVLAGAGLAVRGWALDTELAAFLLDASAGTYDLDVVAETWLGRPRPPEPDRRARPAEPDAGQPLRESEPEAAERWGERADVVGRLAPRLREELERFELERVHDTIDCPLLPLLARMERHGVAIDVAYLRAMSIELGERLERLRAEIHELAGEPINVDSPKQLRELLFGKLGLTAGRKTAKNREASTDAQTLEALAGEHPVAGRILAYRELAKLKGTYVDTLPALVDPASGRVHTRFHPTGAATGRLSSSDPNLQNIPVRTELGRRIRAAFRPAPGHVFLAADYSQVELRILAHMAGDPGLLAAFRRGDDIHRHTAAAVFGVAPELVSETMRRQAKAVNFGIVYGMSETRLARDQGMTRQQARQFIAAYFERFGKVRAYIDETRDRARRDAAVRTLFGRLRRFPQFRQRINRAAQEAALRAAVNTTIQGTAADLIKMAMLEVERSLAARRCGARLLLQVHDELLLEVPRAELAATGALVREAMEGVYELAAPLRVDERTGDSWSFDAAAAVEDGGG